MKSLAEVLSDDNRALLHVIKDSQPESISSLAEMTGRKPGNLSRTLKPRLSIRKKRVIPAKAGIQMIKNFPRKWDNIMILTASR